MREKTSSNMDGEDGRDCRNPKGENAPNRKAVATRATTSTMRMPKMELSLDLESGSSVEEDIAVGHPRGVSATTRWVCAGMSPAFGLRISRLHCRRTNRAGRPARNAVRTGKTP